MTSVFNWQPIIVVAFHWFLFFGKEQNRQNAFSNLNLYWSNALKKLMIVSKFICFLYEKAKWAPVLIKLWLYLVFIMIMILGQEKWVRPGGALRQVEKKNTFGTGAQSVAGRRVTKQKPGKEIPLWRCLAPCGPACARALSSCHWLYTNGSGV